MKKIILGIASLSLLVGATSCSDFLEEKPRTSISLAQYFKKPDHARASINMLYREGVPRFFDATGAYSGSKSMFNGYLSGLFDNEYKGQEVIVQYSQALTITPQNIANELDDVWYECYRAISRANTAIKYIPTTDGLSESERNSLLGQAYFFRAYSYFYLVKAFGDVPLLTEPYESLDNLYPKRTSSTDVYKLIESDLKEAIPGLNNEAFTKNGFRITKGTAETVLANVYLQMSGYPLQVNKYKEAAEIARAVINAGKYAMMTNGATPEESAYNKIRTLDESTEYIFSREYLTPINNAEWRPVYSFPNAAAAWGIFKYSITNNAYGATDVILNAYDPDQDLRIQEKQFFFKKYSYEKDGVVKNVDLGQTCNWLYFDEEAMLETGKGNKDCAVIRYPEVLLIAAEAIAESEGVTAEAVGYLAEVRARAYTKTTKAEIEKSLNGLSKDAFVQEVWAERIREFALEYKIWDDIQRTRKYPTTSASAKGKVNFVDVVGAKNPWGNTFQEKHLLWPISANERQRNPELTQNPGY